MFDDCIGILKYFELKFIITGLVYYYYNFDYYYYECYCYYYNLLLFWLNWLW